jgi:hypothetical protein
MKKAFISCFAFATLLISTTANADTIALTDFEDRASASFAEFTWLGNGDLQFNLGLVDTIADIRGFYFDLEGTGTFDNIDITGADVTAWDTNSKFNGPNITFDFFVEIGTPGAGRDDISTTSFLISNAADFILGDTFGMRLTSVGTNRQESRKMIGTYDSPNPVPESGTMILLGMGLLGIGAIGRRKLALTKK